MYFRQTFILSQKIYFIMTDRKKKTGAGGDGPATIDIPHEEVKENGKASSTVTVSEIPPDSDEARIKNEIAKFNVADSAIAQMKEVYGSLVIKDESDKDGYNQVKKAWNEVRTKRTSLEKKGLELRNQFKVITTAIGKEEDRLIDLITPLENDLYQKWKAIDDEKDRKKKEQEEAEGRQLMARIEELQTLGMKFRDGFYQIGDTITADVATLRAMPIDMFEKLKTAVKNKAAELQKIADDLAEQKRKDEAEQERQRQELKKQQDDLAEQQRQLQAQQDQLKRDQEEAARLKQELRLGKFLALGMTQSADWLVYDNGFKSVSLSVPDIMAWTEESIPAMVKDWKVQMDAIDREKTDHQEQQKREKDEKERREKYIASCMEAIGMVYNWNMRNFQFKLGDIYTELGWNDFSGMDDGAIMAKAKEVREFILKSKKDHAAAEQKKEQDRQKAERLGMTDKTRWDREIEQTNAAALRIVPAEYKTVKYRDKAHNFLDQLTNLINEFK